MKSTIIAALLSLTSALHAGDDFSGYVRQLADDMPERDAVRAERALFDAGIRAFPTLLAHFGDRQLIQVRLNGRAVIGTPTVGDLCFDILQTQIEDNWPKGFRQFYILTPDNAKQWLDDHKGLSLRQLQLVSREESLRRAEASLAAAPSDLTMKAVAFLRKEVAKLKQ
ncbi:MAG: hypothetical protein K8R23_18235 [Chthoniobacter sp.]|nr:hypothetical protein [Chthoniobacter sp.]